MQLEFKETHQVSSAVAEECINGARKELHIGSDNEAEQQHDAIMAEATKMLTEKGIPSEWARAKQTTKPNENTAESQQSKCGPCCKRIFISNESYKGGAECIVM
jgi:hypothetical protein